ASRSEAKKICEFTDCPAIGRLSSVLGRKPLDFPRFVSLPSVPKSVMKSVSPPLPEFDSRRHKDISAPKRWFWHLFTWKFGFQFPPFLLQFGPVVPPFALPRGPSCDTAATRTALEISPPFSFRQFRYLTGDAHLPFQL